MLSVVPGKFVNARIANLLSDFLHGEVRSRYQSASETESHKLDAFEGRQPDCVVTGARDSGRAGTAEFGHDGKADRTSEILATIRFQIPPQLGAGIDMIRALDRPIQSGKEAKQRRMRQESSRGGRSFHIQPRAQQFLEERA